MADSLVEVNPSDLKFRFALNKQLLATITINNRSDQRIAFKIKTTAPKKYVVRPSSGVIEPRTSQAVQVIMQAQKDYPVDFANCKDKFMVQTTALGEEEQIDKDTFSRETRKDLREARLRVVMEGPPAPPSPVPEANEGDVVEVVDHARSAAAVPVTAPIADSGRARVDLDAINAQNASLKTQLNAITHERDELRRKLDYAELQGGAASKASKPVSVDAQMKWRVTIVHIILVAIVAFIIGHYT